MRGHADRNKPAFLAAAQALRADGHVVYSPAEHFGTGRILRNGAQVAKAVSQCLPQCDTIALLPGWSDSTGAKAELAQAQALGKAVMFL